MRSHVIPFSSAAFPTATHLDFNNGYVFDSGGNQLAQMSVKNDTKDEKVHKMCADFIASEAMQLTGNAYRSGFDNLASLSRVGTGSDRGFNSGVEQRAAFADLDPSAVHIQSGLPNFAGGYRNFKPIADMGAPPVVVNKQSDKYWIFSQNDAFQLVEPIAGAGGAQVPEVNPRLSNNPFSTIEYALGGFVPTQVEANADAPLKIRQATLKRVLIALLMRRELRVANLLSNSSNWNSNNVVTLASGFQWDGGASSDPIHDLHSRIEASLGDISGIIMAENLWHAFQRNPSVQKYITYKVGAAPIPGPEAMAGLLELPPIYVGRMKYFAPNGGALTYMWGTSCILIRQPDQMPPTSQDDIATAYTFRWNAAAAAGQASGGFVIREFFNQFRGSMGGSQLVALHHDAEVMTSGLVGGLIAGAYQ
jgi:hypothetical protein